MNKEFVDKNNLNEAVKRFKEIYEYKSPRQSLHERKSSKQTLNEYTFVSDAPLTEDGEDENNGMPPQNGDMGGQMGQQQMPQPDAQNQGGDMNGQMGQQMPPDGSQMPQNGDMMPQGDMQQPPMDNGMGGDMPMDDGMGGEQPPTDNGMGGDMPMDDDIETEEMEPDDEVIDVDDLTQSQEATEYKIDGVDDRLTKIYAVVQDFTKKLEDQEQNIMKLKDEFEKRNPTQTEKFNLRSQASGPFNQSPSDYWDKVAEENPNYEIMRDNDVSPADEQKEFEIKKDDVKGLNMKSIADTLDIDQKLSDYIGF